MHDAFRGQVLRAAHGPAIAGRISGPEQENAPGLSKGNMPMPDAPALARMIHSFGDHTSGLAHIETRLARALERLEGEAPPKPARLANAPGSGHAALLAETALHLSTAFDRVAAINEQLDRLERIV